MLNVKVGDLVTLYHYGRMVGELPVSRVGTKNFYVIVYGREEGYRLIDGRSTRTQPGSGSWAKTPEQIEYERRAAVAQKTLERHGVKIDGQFVHVLATEQLEALAAVASTFPLK